MRTARLRISVRHVEPPVASVLLQTVGEVPRSVRFLLDLLAGGLPRATALTHLWSIEPAW